MNAPLTLPGFEIGALLPQDAIDRQVALGQWFTPPWLALEVVDTVDVRGLVALEPSAGDGAIVAAALERGADAVIAVEIDPAMCDRMRTRFALEVATGRVEIYCADFLTLEALPRFDVAVGNMPYDNGTDSVHLARLADLMVGTEREASFLLRTVALHSGERFESVWSRLAVRRLRACADRIAFPPAGAEPVEAGKIDVSIFHLVDRDALPATFEQPITWIRNR